MKSKNILFNACNYFLGLISNWLALTKRKEDEGHMASNKIASTEKKKSNKTKKEKKQKH